MKYNQLKKKIMNEIAERGLTPKPRWQLLLPDSALKMLAIIISIVGGFALATINFILTDHDWDIFSYLDRSLLEHILKIIPHLWIICFVLLTAESYFIFRKTRRGYRYKILTIAAGSLLGSMVIGMLLVGLGYDHILHNLLLNDVPLYKELIYTKYDVWIFPEQGLLSGKIESMQNNDLFSLRDGNGRLWSIQIADDATIERGVMIAPGTQVKIIGEILDNNEFQAAIIRPWGK